MTKVNEAFNVVYDAIQESEWLTPLCEADHESDIEDAITQITTDILNALLDHDIDELSKADIINEQISNLQADIARRHARILELKGYLPE